MFGDMAFMTIGLSINVAIMMLVILSYYIGSIKP